ncbi:MAG: MBL fold metallo-hydrolase [Actinomycetota bacterium]|nr:MBL fold metallo-hydrolase [Actinomycetota bacterium]
MQLGRVLGPPTWHRDPTEVMPGVHLVHELHHSLAQPLSIFINSAILDGEEPILVETGSRRNREAWLEDTFRIVDPERVRWVFVTHDDYDHTGNLPEVLRLCPNAKFLTTPGMMGRLYSQYDLTVERVEWIHDGVPFEMSDRTITTYRPPVYDLPGTRGILDSKTGVAFVGDCLSTTVPGGPESEDFARSFSDLGDHWPDGMAIFAHGLLAPWLKMVDRKQFEAEVDAFAELGATTILGAHILPIYEDDIPRALDALKLLPIMELPPGVDPEILDLILAATHTE